MTINRDFAATAQMLINRGVGVVSQSGGTPTGAIIQSENNANGTYIRFADGTQICWGGVTCSGSAHGTWTFPAPFVSPPRVQGTALADANSRTVVYSNASETSAGFGAYSVANALVDGTFISTFAIGRWF